MNVGHCGANKIGRANRRPASPLDAGRQFGRASCAPPSLSAAVAHLWRYTKKVRYSSGTRQILHARAELAEVPRSATRASGSLRGRAVCGSPQSYNQSLQATPANAWVEVLSRRSGVPELGRWAAAVRI